MKLKFFATLFLIFALCSAACAAPSITMLSTKTCPACVQMSKVLKQINATYKGKITTTHIYLENNPDIAKKYNVRYVPTLIFRDADGKEFAQEIGYRSLNDVIKIFAKNGVNI